MDLRDEYCREVLKTNMICKRMNMHPGIGLCDKCMNQLEYIEQNKMTPEKIKALKRNAKKNGRVIGKKPCGCSQIGNILVSYWYLFWDIVKGRRASRDIRHRYMTCMYCEYHTWLRWGKWLTNLKHLPKQPYERGKSMFCMKWTCYIEGKIRDKKSKCSLGKWSR